MINADNVKLLADREAELSLEFVYLDDGQQILNIKVQIGFTREKQGFRYGRDYLEFCRDVNLWIENTVIDIMRTNRILCDARDEAYK